MVEAVGHADGDLDPVVGRLEPGVGVSQPDRAQDVGAAPSDLLGEFDDLGHARMGRPEHPAVQFRRGLADRVLEQGAQEFPEPPCAVELPLGVRVPQAFERLLLSVGQVAGVLQDGVSDAAHALRGILAPIVPRLVPQAFPGLVERVAHPGDDAEPVQYAFGVRAVLGDARVDPAGPVAGDDLDGGAPFGRQRLEEQAEHVLAVSVVRPDDPMPLVADDDGQVRVALPVAGLVHADRRQAVERRGHHRSEPFGDPMGDVSRGPPRDMRETADRLLVGDRHQPRALRLEVAREPRAGLRPRHPGDHDAALRAVHARHGGDRFDPPAAEVLVSPAARAAAPVVPGALAPAPRAPEHAPARAHADLEHGLGTQRRVDDARVLDHRVFDVEKLVEYPVHQALCGCLFILVENILPGKRSSLTPSTTQRRNPTHENSNSAWIEGTDTNNLEEDKNIASAILKELLTADQTPWPASAPTNPNDPNWDFWYGGVDCFINFSTPHHVKRRSRNLGSAFTLVIQSRSTFDHIGKNPMQIRHRIRERIAQYDTIPMSPALGEHGNAPELPQSFLGDDNIEASMLLTEQDILRRIK